MKSICQSALKLLCSMAAAVALLLAFSIQPLQTIPSDGSAIPGKSPVSETQHLGKAIDNGACAIEIPVQISVPSASIVRTARTSLGRYLPDFQHRLSLMPAKVGCSLSTHSYRLFEVSAPFACALQKSYFIYTLRRIII